MVQAMDGVEDELVKGEGSVVAPYSHVVVFWLGCAAPHPVISLS